MFSDGTKKATDVGCDVGWSSNPKEENMDKRIVGLIAAIGAIAPLAAAQAAVTPDAVDRAINASSFAELLQSATNAPAILKAANDQRAATAKDGQVQVAQYYGYGYGYYPHYGYGYGGYGYGGYGYPHYGYGGGYGYGYGHGYGYGYHHYGYGGYHHYY
jgi:hypothetical protein